MVAAPLMLDRDVSRVGRSRLVRRPDISILRPRINRLHRSWTSLWPPASIACRLRASAPPGGIRTITSTTPARTRTVRIDGRPRPRGAPLPPPARPPDDCPAVRGRLPCPPSARFRPPHASGAIHHDTPGEAVGDRAERPEVRLNRVAVGAGRRLLACR